MIFFRPVQFSQISIPYGAIKRQIRSSHYNGIGKISIPYGAIKRGGNKRYFALKKLFQFLMVRLKEYLDYKDLKKYIISIPYGAIKSVGVYAFRYSVFKFQFLMVRLKAQPVEFTSMFPSHFNSLWCD